MDYATHAARVLMGDSLGFHIIFVMFGLTLPILVSWFELMGIHRKDQNLTNIAKFWSKIMALLVIAGVISGTVVALQMSLVWPGILKFGGEVIGLPFMFETYAFLIEAVFLGLYMATWNNKHISPTVHWLFGLGIVIGATASAFAITSVNAWMNMPGGFEMSNGALTNIDVFRAMFSQTSIVEFVHSMPGYYLAVSLALAGVYALKLARAKRKDRQGSAHKMDWFVVHKLMIFAAVAFVAIIITADITGKYLAKHEPSKLATIEMLDKTSKNAPFIFGGLEGGDGQIVGPHITIPSGLSVLVTDSPDGEVIGLDKTPVDERPPKIIRPIFDTKLTLVIGITIMIVLYFLLKYLRPNWLANRALLVTSGFCAFAGIIVVELGWMITEIGRQPWAVRGYVKTADAVTKTHDITAFSYIFPLAYVLLFAATLLALRKIVKDNYKKASQG